MDNIWWIKNSSPHPSIITKQIYGDIQNRHANFFNDYSVNLRAAGVQLQEFEVPSNSAVL